MARTNPQGIEPLKTEPEPALSAGVPAQITPGHIPGVSTIMCQSGTIPNLPSVAPAAGSKQMWYDPADSNRVKYVP